MKQAEAVERFLSLEPRSRVLHLGCGGGQHTVQLALRGHRVLGVDINDAALSEARQAAKEQRLNVHFLKSDFLHIPFRNEYDAVVCLAGAFGRLPPETDESRVLDSVRKSLKAGGYFFLELLNKERLMRHFEPGASFNLETGRLETGKRSERVYTLTELKKVLAAGGLEYGRSWGDYDGCAYEIDSRRLLVMARKPFDKPRRAQAPELVSALRIKGRGR